MRRSLEITLEELKEHGYTELLVADLFLEEFRDNITINGEPAEHPRCSICGRPAKIYVYDAVTDKIMCLDCAVKSLEDFIKYLKELRRKVDGGGVA